MRLESLETSQATISSLKSENEKASGMVDLAEYDGVVLSDPVEASIAAGDARLALHQSGRIEFTFQEIYIWNTTGSLIELHYYDRQHPRQQSVSLPSGNSHSFGTAGTPSLSCTSSFTFEKLSPGALRIRAYFENINIEISFEIHLDPTGAGFSVVIPKDGLAERHSHLYRVLGVEILPGFGAARTGETGYLTLPNWAGCQTFFDKNYPREVRQTIYSSNDQWEYVCNMPVFGITREQGTLCGVVAQGDYDAQLVCRVHWEEGKSNSVHPQFIYRWEQEDNLIEGGREVQYYVTPPDASDGEGYVFCGKTLRQFLRQERGLLSWEEKAANRPVVLDYYGRFFLKIFMAYKTPQADGQGPYHSCCTFEEARQVLEKCLALGMNRLVVMLVGWGQDGHDGMPPTRFPVDERLGGEEALRELIAWCRDRDIMLGVHDSYGNAYKCSPEFDLKEVICHRTGEPWSTVIWSGGQAHNLCPSVYVDKYTRRDIASIRALGIYGHHHIDAVGSFMTCFSTLHPLTDRSAFVKEVRKMFDIASQEIGSVSTEYPFGPYFDQMDGFYHSYTSPSAWHRQSKMGKYFLDRVVPLLAVVLHGSANCYESISTFEGEPLERWLQWGLRPQWEVAVRPSPDFTIPAFEEVVTQLAEAYHYYYGSSRLVQRLNDLWIEAIKELAPGVTRTRYSDNTLVYVNSSETAFGDLSPHSYRIEPPET